MSSPDRRSGTRRRRICLLVCLSKDRRRFVRQTNEIPFVSTNAIYDEDDDNDDGDDDEGFREEAQPRILVSEALYERRGQLSISNRIKICLSNFQASVARDMYISYFTLM